MVSTLKVASWNVNSVRVRLPQLLDWLTSAAPDVVCLQETKVTDDVYPAAELRSAGYESVYAGQKTYNGVAILARDTPRDVRVGLPGDDETAQKRLIAARLGGVTIVNVYVPNGSEVGSEKYAYKMGWLERLAGMIGSEFDPAAPLVVCGDFNIAPEDRDVHAADAVRGTIMFSDDEHRALGRLTAWGLQDTLRIHTQEGGLYSWWDYRAAGFRRNLGWRIDLILATKPLAERCRSASIDVGPRGLERPSDHTPVLAEFELP